MIINTDTCFECGIKEYIERHHVVPQSKGGTKMIPLCYMCHRKVHGGDPEKQLCNSTLTKEGIERARKRGAKLGNRTNLKEAGEKGRDMLRQNADEFALSLSELVMNDKSHSQVARELNSYNIPTRRGGKWYQSSVSNLRKRLGWKKRKFSNV